MKNKKDDIFDIYKHLQKIIFNIYRFIPHINAIEYLMFLFKI